MITCAREPAVRPNGAGLGAKADAVAQAAIQSMIRMFNVEQSYESQRWWPRKVEQEGMQRTFFCGAEKAPTCMRAGRATKCTLC